MAQEPKDAAKRDREEAIAPIRRTPAAASGTGAVKRPERRFPVAAAVGIALAVLLLAVFFALPRWVAPDRQLHEAGAGPVVDAPAVTSDEAPAAPPLTPEALAELRAEAESVLGDVLELDEALKLRSAEVWGGENRAAFDAIAREGDDAFLADDFPAALERYRSALELGRALIAQSDRIMVAALDAGDAALAAGNATLATEQYEIVLTVDPDNARATRGIARADRLPEVLKLVRDADRARQAGELELARDGYRAALDVDGEWAPAARALDEVTTAIANARFDRQLSAGFAALADEDYDAAVEAFTGALVLKPDAEAAHEGLAQAEQGRKLDAIALAEIRALAFERRELWDQAIERYQAALATDSTLVFAAEGLARARARADLDDKLENLIDNPRLLLDDQILADARELLDEAASHADSGERIAAQTDRLRTLVEAASRPVTVRLESDRLTEVTVYRIGELGAFAEKDIAVRPGTYTAVGSRNGYRDVRRTFTVLPGRTAEPVRVVCVEPI